jgi:hypothetical protein
MDNTPFRGARDNARAGVPQVHPAWQAGNRRLSLGVGRYQFVRDWAARSPWVVSILMSRELIDSIMNASLLSCEFSGYRPRHLEGIMNFLRISWIVTGAAACIALLQFIGSMNDANGAPQQAAGAAIALAIAVVPYIFTRAVEGFVADLQAKEKPSARRAPEDVRYDGPFRAASTYRPTQTEEEKLTGQF